MIFLNPWALIGLLAIAAPVLAHLFARRPARRQRYPSLRFLPHSRLTPVRRARLTDRGLLALRAVIVGFVAVALAQPACRIAGDRQGLDDAIARAIVIDTSASMNRDSAPGLRAVDAARRAAAEFAASATLSRVVESDTPAELLGASAAWLATLSMRREIVIVSDFQRGQIEDGDLAGIPKDVGVRPIQIGGHGAVPAETAGRSEPGVTILASETERAAAEAAWQAAVARGAPVSGLSDRPVAIAWPEYQARGTLTANATPLDQAWMFDVIAAVTRDPLSYLYVRELSWTGLDINSRRGVVLLSGSPPGSVAAAALLGAVARAISGEPPAIERSTEVVAADELARWARDPALRASPSHGNPPPQGRWLWGLALVLLLVESVVRRAGPNKSNELQHERAA